MSAPHDFKVGGESAHVELKQNFGTDVCGGLSPFRWSCPADARRLPEMGSLLRTRTVADVRLRPGLGWEGIKTGLA